MTTYYSVSGWPITGSRGTSSLARSELVLIQTGFATVNTEMITKGAKAGETWTGTHNFTGATLTAATQAANDNSTKVATTAYADLKGAKAGATWTGTHDFTGATASFASPTATTQAANDNSTKVATTAYADRKGAITGQTWTGTHDFTGATASFASPTATTQAVGDSSTKVATTAFVAANQVLSQITAAAAANTIANADYAQVWNWALTTAGKTAFKFGETSASTNGAGSQYLVNIATAAASTANPFNVATRGVDTIVVSRTGDVTITALNGTTGSGTTGSAVSITAGLGAATSNGGAVNITAGAAGATSGTGGAVNITSGAGSATTGAAGAIAITAGSATSANGASVTITAGSGAGGTNSGGNINLVPGAAVSTGTPGEVRVNGDANLLLANWQYSSNALGTGTIFIAPRACLLKMAKIVWGTASSSWTLDLVKCTGTQTGATGTTISTAGINTGGTASTVNTWGLKSTVATLTLAAGDRIAINGTGTVGALAACNITLGLTPL